MIASKALKAKLIFFGLSKMEKLKSTWNLRDADKMGHSIVKF